MTFLPKREADLIQWSRNFDALITATPEAYGLDAAQAATYAALHATFETAYQIATDAKTRTHSAILAKNNAKRALVDEARKLVKIIQAYPGTTDAQRGDLQITVPDVEPSPVPIPSTAPDITVLSVSGRTVHLRLRDSENPESRGKPEGVVGASVFYYVSEEPPPTEAEKWTFAANTTRPLIDVEFPPSVVPGSRVWITAFWFNTKAQSSPAASAVSTRFADGMQKKAA